MISRFEGDGIERELTPCERHAWGEGKGARHRGLRRNDNPYEAGAWEARAWEGGWHDEDQLLNAEAQEDGGGD